MNRAMQEKQYSEVANNAKVLMKLVGLEAKIKNPSENVIESRIDKTSVDKQWQKWCYYETISENPWYKSKNSMEPSRLEPLNPSWHEGLKTDESHY